jgi:hypothetical protein
MKPIRTIKEKGRNWTRKNNTGVKLTKVIINMYRNNTMKPFCKLNYTNKNISKKKEIISPQKKILKNDKIYIVFFILFYFLPFTYSEVDTFSF